MKPKPPSDVLKVVYARYGGFDRAVSNADIIQILDSITTFHFHVFSDKFIFSAEKLPLKTKGASLSLDWLISTPN